MAFETPTVKEIPSQLAAVEHDPFIDGLESPARAAGAERHAPTAESADRQRVIAEVGRIARETAIARADQQRISA